MKVAGGHCSSNCCNSDGMEETRSQEYAELGLSEAEGAFYGILIAEITKELVAEFEAATQIVGFWDTWTEVKRIKRQIKRSILDQPFDNGALVDDVTERFMDLARVRFPWLPSRTRCWVCG